MKKLILMSASLFAAVMFAAEASPEGVINKNSDLDGQGSKIEGWRWWQAKGDKGQVTAADGVVRITQSADGSVFQEIESLQPGEKYIFMVKARSNGGKATPTMVVYMVDAKDNIIKSTVRRGSFGKPDIDGWRTGKLVFFTPEVKNYALARVMFGSSGPKGELSENDWCEFDKAELVSAVSPGVLNQNSDLDGEDANVPGWKWWRAHGDGGKLSAVGGVVRIAQSGNSSMYQKIKNIQPGKTYSFTVRTRVTGDKVTPTMTVYMVDAKDNIIKSTVKRGSFGEPDEDGWRTGEIVFTAPADGNYAETLVLFGSSGSGADIPRGNQCEFDKAELRAK